MSEGCHLPSFEGDEDPCKIGDALGVLVPVNVNLNEALVASLWMERYV